MLTVFFILNDHGGVNIYVVCMGYLCICGQLKLFRNFQRDIKSELITPRRETSYLHTTKR